MMVTQRSRWHSALCLLRNRLVGARTCTQELPWQLHSSLTQQHNRWVSKKVPGFPKGVPMLLRFNRWERHHGEAGGCCGSVCASGSQQVQNKLLVLAWVIFFPYLIPWTFTWARVACVAASPDLCWCYLQYERTPAGMSHLTVKRGKLLCGSTAVSGQTSNCPRATCISFFSSF